MTCTPGSSSVGPGETLFVTSTTRPTTFPELQTGRRIFEVDTNRYWVYNGATWQFDGYIGAAARVGVAVTDSPTQAIATATLTTITWGAELWDVDGWASGGTDALTTPAGWDGVWLLTLNAAWASNSLGTTPEAVITVNGSVVAEANGLTASGTHTVARAFLLAAADVVRGAVFQNSGGPINCTGTMVISWLGR